MKTVCLMILAYAGVFFGNAVFCFSTNELLFTNSVLSVLLFVIIFLLLRKSLASPEAFRAAFRPDTAGVCGIFFTLAMIVGRQLENDENLTVNMTFLAAALVWSLITSILLRHVWESFPTVLPACNQAVRSDREDRNMEYVYPFGNRISVDVLTFFGMVAAYVIVLLGVYPGFFTYDAMDEWLQVETGRYSPHHPLPHVLLLGGTVKLIYKLTGSNNLGIACYVFLQLLFISLLLTYVLRDLRRETGSQKSQLFFTLYYMLFPVVSMYVLCTTKDSLFSAFLVLVFFLTRKLILHTEAFFASRICTPSVYRQCRTYDVFSLQCVVCFFYICSMYRNLLPISKKAKRCDHFDRKKMGNADGCTDGDRRCHQFRTACIVTCLTFGKTGNPDGSDFPTGPCLVF